MSRAFLNVERSASGRRWQARLDDARIAEAISQRHELPAILGRVLAARGVGVEEAEAFLNPTLRGLMPQPAALRDMERGAARLAEAVMGAEKIGIISDYDVDGVASAALLSRFLDAVGSSCSVRIPDRVSEGYGPSEKAVEILKAEGTELLLT
ncbi:MAG: single-stranded-DNA-specific exonuclease RecJ, partial [Rhizobiales bacterium]|nr:single-stranded-DNA-specific exonuclease RecJ [Hyphomicrobiales bacterium]